MKKLTLLLAFLTLTAPTFAQVVTGRAGEIQRATSAPSGACTAGQYRDYGGALYSCQSGTWALSGVASVPAATSTVQGKAVLGAKDVTTVAGLGTCAAGNVGQSKRVTDGNKGTYTCTNTTGSTYAWVDDDPVFRPERFGAMAGDVTTVLNTTLAAMTGGGVLKIPKGSYTISAALTPLSNTVIDGGDAILTQTANVTNSIYLNNKTNVMIKNLNLVGVGTDYVGANTAAILINILSSSDIRVESCGLTNFGNSGVRIESSTNIWVSKNIITGVGSPTISAGGNYNFGIYLAGVGTLTKGVFIAGNTISATATGIVSDTDFSEISITNNRIVDIVGQHGIYVGVFNSVIADNIVARTALDGILLQINSSALVNHKNTTISGNTIDVPGGAGIDIAVASGTQSFSNVMVTGNIITSPSGTGIYLTHATAGYNIENILIANNTIIATTGYGIFANRVTGEISGNYIHSSVQNGLYLASNAGTDLTFVNNNTFINVATNATIVGPYAAYFTVTTSVATGNIFSSLPAGCTNSIYTSASAAATLFGNVHDTSKPMSINGAVPLTAPILINGNLGLGVIPTNKLDVSGNLGFGNGSRAIGLNGSVLGFDRGSSYFSGFNLLVGATNGVQIADTGAQTTTSASANALTVGANGATNPVLKVDASTASVATGISVTGAAAGSGATVAAISSGSNENLILAGKGTGVLKLNSPLSFTSLAFSTTAPTVTSAGTSPSITANNGTAAFLVDVGTGGTATTIVLAMPTAATGWICHANNLTAAAANRADRAVRQTASTTTSVTLQLQSPVLGTAVAFAASDVVACQCTAF